MGAQIPRVLGYDALDNGQGQCFIAVLLAVEGGDGQVYPHLQPVRPLRGELH